MNNSLWHGGRARVTSGSYEQTFTGGFFEFATANTYDVSTQSGILTLDQLYDIIYEVAEYGSMDKMLFAGKNLWMQIQMWFANQVEIVAKKLEVAGTKDSLSINVGKLSIGGRSVEIVEEPSFRNQYAGYAALVDKKHVKLAEFEPMRVISDIQDKSSIYIKKDTITSTCGLHFENNKAHGVITGVAATTSI
jgi:hypothetical protein